MDKTQKKPVSFSFVLLPKFLRAMAKGFWCARSVCAR